MRRIYYLAAILFVLVIAWIIFQVFLNYGSVRVSVSPSNSQILLDGSTYSINTEFDKKLRPGIYELRVKKAGYETRIETINIKRFSTTQIEVALRELTIKELVTQAAGNQIDQRYPYEIRSERFYLDKTWLVGLITQPAELNLESAFFVLQLKDNEWQVVLLGTGNFDDYQDKLPPEVYNYMLNIQ